MKKPAPIVLSLVLVLASAAGLPGQDRPDASKEYRFILRDDPARLFTMRQLDQDALSGYRLFADLVSRNFSPAISAVIQGVFDLGFFKTLTHEEAHRSILVGEDIGAVSHPFPFEKRSGYVDGVTDAVLRNLRDTDFPAFIRLHTAGFESDYMLATREETLMAFGDESPRTLIVEYLLRKVSLVRYLTEGLFHHDTDGPEEANELERDIVGNDLYGAIRHLFRPTMTYTRYTRLADLTGEERGYLRRVEWRAFLNLVNPNVIGATGFRLSEDLRLNVGLGHCLGPFGDFIDEKVWLAYRRSVKVTAYLREFENLDRWFLAGGIGLLDFPVAKRLAVSAAAHYWNQPAGLSFTARSGRAGGAVDVTGRYRFLLRPGARVRSLSADLGLIWKTAGFLPEELALGRHFGLRCGLTLGLRGQ
jgi:hypothetical protein